MSTYISIHPLKDEFERHAKAVEDAAKAAVECHNPIVKEIHTVETVREVLALNDLQEQVDILNRNLSDWATQHRDMIVENESSLRAHGDLFEAHEKELRVLTDLVASLIQERDVNNREKEQIISKLNDYYIEAHPDCFLEHTDGRKTFRNDLLTYKQDMILRQLLAKEPPVREVHTVTKVHVQWPVWAIAAALVVVEALRIFGKI